MNIEESIKMIAEEHFSEYGYMFANWYEADVKMNRAKCPFILALVPVAGTIRRKNGRTRNRETIMIGFFDKVRKDASSEDNAQVYNAMRELATSFISKIEASGLFEPLPDDIQYQPWVEKFSDIVTGVVVTLDLETVGAC